ncbi:hypothetical protein [Sorangium sp. So ce1182]|uniref:hypothetical protein n=1 Tax=Sorangium sp. So ce1182 TaxID=3133334 RepID=UPI003F611268
MTGAAGGERSRLVRALALSRRFHLYLARCASPRAADGLVAALSDELPRLGRAESRLVRLEPYSGREADTPLTDGELAERVLVPLLDPPEELRGAIHLVDASRASYADTEAWARLFSLWNEKRNVIGPSRGEVVVMLPAALAPVFATAAPDVWSIRSGEYVIDEDAVPRGAGLEVRAQGSIAFVGAARVALPALSATVVGSVSGRVGDALLLSRAVSPLSLFGGDLVVQPWVEDLLSDAAAPDLSEPTFYDHSFYDDRSFYDHDRSEDGTASIAAQRTLRLAEWELACRRFDAAEALFAGLLERADGNPADRTARALSGLAISLAARGRAVEAVAHADRALLLLGSKFVGDGRDAPLSRDTRARALGANALVWWCLGHLDRAEQLDRERSAMIGSSRRPELARVLRLVERGRLATARRLVQRRERFKTKEPVARLVVMDLEFLAGDLDTALRHTDIALALMQKRGLAAYGSLHDRCFTAMALIEIARGNEERASKLLSRPRDGQTLPSPESDPEGGFRADAFHAYASGILAAVTGDGGGASGWFERALARVAEWGRSGLDFRSRMRAQAAVALLWTVVQSEGEPFLAAARDVVAQTEALLGDTEEDCMSRVLAVAAHRELAHRLARVGASDARSAAHRAAALAQPLGGLGVPAWDELLHAAERSR